MEIPRLAIAAGNGLGAEAAEKIARDGGNAVDACLAASVMAWVAEPFFASTAGSGFIVVRTPDGEVEVIDGNNAMPHTQPAEPGQGLTRTFIPDYSDGMHTGIGAGGRHTTVRRGGTSAPAASSRSMSGAASSSGASCAIGRPWAVMTVRWPAEARRTASAKPARNSLIPVVSTCVRNQI